MPKTGYKQTEQHKLNTSKAKKGKISEAMRVANAAKIGKKHSFNTRKKISAAKNGEDVTAWSGFKTPKLKLLRVSVEYQNWRKAVFQRDNFTCVNCKAHGVHLNADHIKPFAHYPELRFDVANGRTLCEECHKDTNTFAWKSRRK